MHFRITTWVFCKSNSDLEPCFRFDFACQEGSFEFLREFLETRKCEFLDALSECCNHFRVDVGRQSFLGAGATGRVWRVHRRVDQAALSGAADSIVIDAGDGDAKSDAEIARPLALKITDTVEKSHALAGEHALYCDHRCGISSNIPVFNSRKSILLARD